jgi:hypothetical protein
VENNKMRPIAASAFIGLATFAAGDLAAQPLPPITPSQTPESGVPTPTYYCRLPTSPTAAEAAPSTGSSYLERGTTILDRQRPELTPIGFRFGSFLACPRVELDEVYNDNIFASSNRRRNDWITVISPQFEVRSNWSQHEIALTTGASVGTYIQRPQENYADYFVTATGQYDITRNHAVFGRIGYDHVHEERDSPDNPGNSANPVEFDVYRTGVSLASRGLRIGYQVDADYRYEDYKNVAAIGTPILLNEDTRDNSLYSLAGRVSYEIAPRYQAFVQTAVNYRAYNGTQAGVDRNSTGYRGDVGAKIDITGVSFAEAFVGYLVQDYEDARLSNVQGFDAGLRVVWNPTQITSVTFLADRNVQDSNSITLAANGQPVTTSGYLRSNVGVSVDHELMRNLLLNGRFNYQNDDYEGVDRTDDRIDVGAGLRYSLTRNVYLGGSYTYTNRTSSGAGAFGDFHRNLFLIRLGAQL